MSCEPSPKQLKTPAGSCGWLEALTVALGQASEAKWYASTLELQLVSFEVCVACRDERTLRVTVDRLMPPSLWDDDDPFGDSFEARAGRRLPGLRAAGVSWQMLADMFVPILSESRLLREVEWMEMGGVNCNNPDTKAPAMPCWGDLALPETRLVHSPRSYFEAMLTFRGRKDNRFNSLRSLGSISWPPALRQLSLGWLWNDYRMDWEGLPSSLGRLALGGQFNQPIESFTWPVSLMRLTLGGDFNQRITENVVWPASLLQLTFGDDFNQPITDVVWPASLVQLTFGHYFDQPITDVVWPASLRQLAFRNRFNQPITRVVWPASLLQLAFGLHFNQPIADVVWPASLQQLTFAGTFDQPIENVVWPASITRLDFWGNFNHPINNVSWPSTLQSLAFGHAFKQPVEGVVWPASLRWLLFCDNFNQPTDAVVWPPSLKLRIYGHGFDPPGNGVHWPPAKDMFDYPKIEFR